MMYAECGGPRGLAGARPLRHVWPPSRTTGTHQLSAVRHHVAAPALHPQSPAVAGTADHAGRPAPLLWLVDQQPHDAAMDLSDVSHGHLAGHGSPGARRAMTRTEADANSTGQHTRCRQHTPGGEERQACP
jgi:hypothetical protein